MVVTTESGAQYRIIDGLCKKYDAYDVIVDVFKVYSIKALDEHVESWEDIHNSEDGPAVGKRMYVSGPNSWWISTKVVSVSEVSSSDN
jgi:hypothetical protein